MKVTMSRDGQHRVSVRTHHRLSGRKIATMELVYRHSGYGAAQVGQQWSRTCLERFLRQVLTVHGDEAWSDWTGDWKDDLELDGQLETAVRWAIGLVCEHLPGLVDRDLWAWEQEVLGPRTGPGQP